MLQGEKNCIRGCEQMLFSSLTFLFCFLPATVGVYYLVRRELRNIVLLLASILFYAWGEIRYLPVIFMTIGMSYAGALCIEHFRHKRIWLTFWVLSDLSLLLYFKYTNFFLENLSLLFQGEWTLKVVLPLGISFYTFQALSYLIDVYRGQVKAQRNFLKIALYIILFPQLIAGPIVKYHDIAEQIDTRQETIDHVYYGIRRFIIGLAKKVLIANTLGGVADEIFMQPVSAVETSIAWLGSLMRALQVYYDFSGYSDMAIGLGAIFGFKFLENFNYPYIAKSMSEYWRRWHISLGTWCKDYIYIPLGGSHVATWRVYCNLFILFFIIGLWHGATWNFVAFGLVNAIFIMIERFFQVGKRNFSWLPQILLHLYVVFIFMINAILANTDTLQHSWNHLLNMFACVKHNVIMYHILYSLDGFNLIILCTAVFCCFPVFKNILTWGRKYWVVCFGIDAWLLFLLILCCMQLAVSTYNPFIYFRF